METSHKVQAVVYPDQFSMNALKEQLTASPSSVDPWACVTRKTSDGGTVYYFNFGAIAFFDTSAEVRAEELKRFSYTNMPQNFSGYDEDFLVVVAKEEKPKVEFNRMVIDKLTSERAEVIASTVAQSVTMEWYEKMVENIYSGVDQMIAQLREKGTISPFPGKLHQKIGDALEMRGNVVRILHLLDRPDLIWDDSTMDGLYNDLRANFDLNERFQALEYKLNLIQDTLQILLDTARDRRLYWLEAIIVLLIAFEIAITLYDRF